MACSDCSSGCVTWCKGTCSGSCSGTCDWSCNDTCYHSCDGTCDFGCYGRCEDHCSYGCSGDCTGGCSSNCASSCTGGCKGTCSGDCNNACTAANQSSVIANLGKNILDKGYLLPNDFTELRNAIHTELQRRGKTVPPAFSVNPATGVKALVEHASKVYNGIYTMDSSKDYRTRAAQGKVIATNDIADAIDYIKTLMAQNIKQ